jgi:hypothetical protein
MPSNGRQRVAHRGVAALAHVVDQRADRRAQFGVEDVVEAPRAQRCPLGLVASSTTPDVASRSPAAR